MKTIDRLNNLRNALIGKHRLEVDENWPKVKLEHIEADKQMLMARLIGNVCRRLVSSEEKGEMLAQLGEIYLQERVERGEIAYKIAEETGMSYRWVMKYMPARYKARSGAGGPSGSLSFYEGKGNGCHNIYESKSDVQKGKVARFATPEYKQLLGEPKEEEF